MISIPNMSIVQRDDWIEITIVGTYDGSGYMYKILPSGLIIRAEMQIGWSGPRIEQTVSMYQMLTDIATYAYWNIDAMENGL